MVGVVCGFSGILDTIIGHIDLRAHNERLTEHRCLLGMGVDRDHRNIGLGKNLIEHADGWVKANAPFEWEERALVEIAAHRSGQLQVDAGLNRACPSSSTRSNSKRGLCRSSMQLAPR